MGTAILYNVLFKHLLEELPHDSVPQLDWRERLTNQLGLSGQRETVMAAHSPCPACRERDMSVKYALEILQIHSNDAELLNALRTGNGLCLPHLRQALDILEGQASTILLEHQREFWQQLQSQLAEFIRKHDYRFHDEGFGAESDVWERVVRATVGEPDIF